MAADLILTAASIITMDDRNPRVQALAIDTSTGAIVAAGTHDECAAAAPGATVQDLGDSVLMPGFIDPHNHPALSGITTQAPCHWIAPYVGYPTFADVEELFRKLDAETPAGQALFLNGLDRLLQGAPDLDRSQMDGYFPTRPVAIIDNSAHQLYFNTAATALVGWKDATPPPDPTGARFGRMADGTSDGRAYETAAIAAVMLPVLKAVVQHPLQSVGSWFRSMAANGITTSSEHFYTTQMLKGYAAISTVPNCLLRIALYHVATAPDATEPLPMQVDETMLWKRGVKLWADGSPWTGTMAASFPYLQNEVTETAQIPAGPGGEAMMNYTRTEFDAALAPLAPLDWQVAVHVNGDVGIDVVLDAFERALDGAGKLGSDHRWRLEHCGAGRGDQFQRAARMGATVSFLAGHFTYFGDILDGTLFEPWIGSQWVRGADAVKSGMVMSLHNDGSVSPPIPLLNIQGMVTRCTPSGTLHGPQQAISMHDALKAHTVNAAWQLGREHDLGSLAVGKLADLVELSADPYAVDPHHLTDEVTVRSTWHGGRKLDPDAFMAAMAAMDQAEHQALVEHAATHQRCCGHGGPAKTGPAHAH